MARLLNLAPIPILILIMGATAACSSNPPPRPLPQPLNQPLAQDRTQTQSRAQTRAPQDARPATAHANQPTDPATPPADTRQPDAAQRGLAQAQAGEPSWYRPGVFAIEGVEHRAFAVTAADVRSARNQAMQRAYEAYPNGAVAAHQAIRLEDGSWRFYVLVADGGT